MLIGGLLGLLILALWVYCIVDVVVTDDSRVRNLPKLVWLLLVIFLPTIGSLLWLFLGRPEPLAVPRAPAPRAPRARRPRPGPRPRGPEDSPEFLARIEERAKELRDPDGDDPDASASPG